MPGTNDWLRKAHADLKLASKAIGDDETLDPAVYLAHQCAEKSLKTLFIFKGSSVPKIHFLQLIFDDCAKIDMEFLMLRDACRLLDPYGINARYPNDGFFVNQQDLAQAIVMARMVLNFVKNKVSRGR